MKGTLLIGRGVKRTWAAAVGFSSGDRPKGPPFVLNALGLPLGDFTKINKTVYLFILVKSQRTETRRVEHKWGSFAAVA